MNSYEFGAGVTLALALIGWGAAIEIRMRNLQGSLLISQEEVKDEEIVQKVHALSDAELDALLPTGSRSGASEPGSDNKRELDAATSSKEK